MAGPAPRMRPGVAGAATTATAAARLRLRLRLHSRRLQQWKVVAQQPLWPAAADGLREVSSRWLQRRHVQAGCPLLKRSQAGGTCEGLGGGDRLRGKGTG